MSISKIKLANNTVYEIIPHKLTDSTYTVSLPTLTADATFALSSDLSKYLPLSGGTLTGDLTFSSGKGISNAYSISCYYVNVGSLQIDGSVSAIKNVSSLGFGNTNYQFKLPYSGSSILELACASTSSDVLTIKHNDDDTAHTIEFATTTSLSDGTDSITITDIINKQDKLVSGTNIKTVNGDSLLGYGDITTTDTTYTLTADTASAKITLTPSSGTAQSITVPYATKAANDKNGNNIVNTYLKKSKGTITNYVRIGDSVPAKGDGVTPYFETSIQMLKTASAIDGLFVNSAKKDYFAGLFLNSDFIGTCSYKGNNTDTASPLSDGNWIVSLYTSDSNGYSGYLGYLFDGSLSTNISVPISSLSTKPFVLTIKKAFNSSISATDVLTLQLTGDNYSGDSSAANYAGYLNAYKLEILTDYDNDTWIEVFNRSGVNDPIGSIIIPTWSTLPGDSSFYKYICGIRLTITEATPYSTNTFFSLSSVRLLDNRPASSSSPADAVSALSAIGNSYLKGSVILTNGVDSASSIYPYKNNTCYIGSNSNRFAGIYSTNFIEGGTFLFNKYQSKLSTSQLSAVNSGITSTKVSTYDGYSTTISNKADKTAAVNSLSVSGTTLSYKDVNGTQLGSVTLPSSTDTKNTAGSSNSTSKLFLVGTTTQSSTGVESYSNNNVYTANNILYTNVLNVLDGGAQVNDDNDNYSGIDNFSAADIDTTYYSKGMAIYDNDNTTTYNLSYPAKSGTLATISDIPTYSYDSSTGTLSITTNS